MAFRLFTRVCLPAVVALVAISACTASHRGAAAPASSLESPIIAPSSPGLASSGPPSSEPAPSGPTLPVLTSTKLASAIPSRTSATSNATSPRAQPTKAAATPTKPPTLKPAPVKPAPTPIPVSKPVTPTPALLVSKLANLDGARQVVVVTATSWNTDLATLQTFESDAGSWHAVFAPMPAHIGLAGFSADRHEGDNTTPTGIFGFGTMFGQRSNPGVIFPYRQADAQSVWVDDSSSPYYNTWQENAALPGEHLDAPGYAVSYAYAVDIAYNTAPIVPGKGSAIFLHVTDGGGTAGCVSLPESDLLEVLRWLNPASHPVIVMAPSSTIDQY